jgi:hypothetical protein
MGWCGATEIMDTALGAADAVVTEVIEAYAQGNADAESIKARTDDMLRPFVEKLASMLRDNDWDCINESKYYDRFAQEMHGDTDTEYGTRLVEKLADAGPADRPFWIAKLNKHYEKVGRTDGAG